MRLSIDAALQWELLQVAHQLFCSRLSCYNYPNSQRDSVQYDRLRNDIDFFQNDVQMILSEVQPHFDLSAQAFDRCIGSLDMLLQAFEDLIDDSILPRCSQEIEISDTSHASDAKFPKEETKSKPNRTSEDPCSQLPNGLAKSSSTSSLSAQTEASCTSQPLNSYPKLKAVRDKLNEKQEHPNAIEYLDSVICLGATDYKFMLKIIKYFSNDMRQVYICSEASENEALHTNFKTKTVAKSTSQKAQLDAICKSAHLARNMIQNLHSSLTGRLPDCHSVHKARLHLPVQEKINSHAPDSGINVDIYLSTCAQPLDWQGAKCLIQSSLGISCQSRPNIRNLCHTIKKSQARRQILHLLSMGENLHTLPYPREQPSNPSHFPSISLRSLLDHGYFSQRGKPKVSLKEKRALAVVLAHLMIQLCDGPWIQEKWDASNIYFLYDPSTQRVINLRQPYIDSSLSSNRTTPISNISTSDDNDQFHRFPLILDFARLLIEIQHGETMKPTEEDYDVNTLESTPNTPYFMVNRIFGEISDDIFEDYKTAIEACLDCEQFLPPGATSFDHPDFRDLIYQNVVLPLEEELFKGFRIKVKELNTLLISEEARLFQKSASIQISSIDNVSITNTTFKETQGPVCSLRTTSFRYAELKPSTTEYPNSMMNGRMGASQTRVDTFSSSAEIPPADSFRIAIICPMAVELAPILALLDGAYQSIPLAMQRNNYTLGRIGDHNVVITVMPGIGNNRAAAVVTQLTNDFKSLEFGLLVGVGGGIPDIRDQYDIRLGDVVVSKPTTTFGGAVQFDRGKTHPEHHFERTGHLNKPSWLLMSTLEKLIALHKIEPSKINDYLSEMTKKNKLMVQNGYVHPGEEHDVLYKHTYRHISHAGDCKDCDPDMRVERQPRASLGPIVHYGTIGSANTVLKDGDTRERLRKDLGIICVDMEAAGIIDDLPCLIIRGICDYADSHKAKRWQPYAAATAAAFAKEFLSIVPAGFCAEV